WAGQYRSVNMSKDGFPFAPASQLARLMQELDTQCPARDTPCSAMTRDALSEAIATVHVELIPIHQYRLAHGRISRRLADVMAVQAGREPLDYSAWERNRGGYVAAIQRGLDRDYEPMKYWVGQALDAV